MGRLLITLTIIMIFAGCMTAEAHAGTIINRDPYPHTVRIEASGKPAQTLEIYPGNSTKNASIPKLPNGIVELPAYGQVASLYGNQTVIIFNNQFALRDLTNQRLLDLTAIRTALEAYKGDHGEYPVQEEWAALHGHTPGSGKQWIPGLVPDYQDALPRDPRKDTLAEHQYLYKSNGRTFKLIAHDPPDMQSIFMEYPELVDPKRPGNAYGFWGEDAEYW